MLCTSALIIKEKKTFKNQNGVTVVQASILELGGHGGCDFRCIPASLRTLRTFLNSVRLKDAPSHSQNKVYWQLQLEGLRVSPGNCANVSNQSLFSKHPYFLQLQLQLLTNNLYNFVGFALISVCVCSVMSDSLCTRDVVACQILCPWDSPDKNTGVDCHALLQGIFLTQESKPCVLHWQAGSLPLCHLRRLDQSPAFVVQWNTIQVLLDSVSPRL